ncbi:MAG TPA: prepilin-type N-terminal cleavage/methylation domain-containing protein [Thiotrichales bacterium]|nr:prepilin-type N-terminal cleavage/methylation domain-containing protein [Thiotrichales bacterium]
MMCRMDAPPPGPATGRPALLTARQAGLTLPEIMVVLAIVGFMAVIAGTTLMGDADMAYTRDCTLRIAADLQQARSLAEVEGERAVLQLANGSAPEDLDGDGSVEFYILFIDADRDGAYTEGETVSVHGQPGDALCAGNVEIDPFTTLPDRRIVFNTLGSILNLGAVNRNLYVSRNGMVARLEVTSLTGATRNYLRVNDEEWNTSGCDLGNGYKTDSPTCWQEVTR